MDDDFEKAVGVLSEAVGPEYFARRLIAPQRVDIFDSDGRIVMTLSAGLAMDLAGLEGKGVLQARMSEIIGIVDHEATMAYKTGLSGGRTLAIRDLHEMLGISRIVAAIESASIER